MAFEDLVELADRACIAALGPQSITYTSGAAVAVVINAIFDDSTVSMNSADTQTNDTGPWVFVRLDDLSSDPDQDEPTITIGAQQYRVADVDRDNMGGARLRLHRSA